VDGRAALQRARSVARYHAYMPTGGCDQSALVGSHTTGTITSGTNALAIAYDNNFKMAAHLHCECRSSVHSFDSLSGIGSESKCRRHGRSDHGALQGCGD